MTSRMFLRFKGWYMPDMRSEKNSQAADSESMQAQSTYRNVIGSQEWLIGGGQMGDRIRAMDWAATPLGPRHSWLQSLRTTVNLILSTQFPMCILWGDALIMIYNEGYRIIAAGKDPAALGRSSREVWPEVWEFNKPIFEKVMINRETVYLENQIYTIARKGHAEQACFTICYSPIYDESGKVAGTLVTLVETTRQIQREKRSEEALKSSEEKYRSLFNSIDEGFFLIDVIFDQNDKPVDLLYVEANPAATRIVGCDYTGRHLTEIDPNYETYWFEIFGDVAKTGRSVRMEDVF
jgi:PAS domain-containing protein